MEWVRGEELGHGSFATVNLAITRRPSSQFPSLMAVKSCDVWFSNMLKDEKEILNELGFCQQIVTCFGDDYTIEHGSKFYNIFLEFASKGNLSDEIKKSNNNNGGGLEEFKVRKYTKSVLKGLNHIHSKGFVHCDIKPQNLLVFSNGEVKIADFGLAKKSGPIEKKREEDSEGGKLEYRGTPMYMSPESVNDNEYESPGDIWALGCVVLEMLTGKPAWNHKTGLNMFALLIKIGVGDELPLIPEDLSDEGKDFLMKCFVKDLRRRWSADMLLGHPYVAGVDDKAPLKKKGSRDCLLDRNRSLGRDQRNSLIRFGELGHCETKVKGRFIIQAN